MLIPFSIYNHTYSYGQCKLETIHSSVAGAFILIIEGTYIFE